MHNDIQFCLHCLRDQFWAQTLDGLTLGAVYALIALGYTLVYGILLMINFAHGEIFMSGAYIGYFVITAFQQTGFLMTNTGMAIFQRGSVVNGGASNRLLRAGVLPPPLL